MNRLSLFAIAASLVVAPFAAKADTIINLNATVNNGTSIGGTTNTLAPSFYQTITLGPGTYSVSVIGTAQGGAYNGWSQAEGSNGLAGAGTWQERTGFSLGGTTFSTAGGNNTYSPYPNNVDQQIFEIGNGNCGTAGNCFNSDTAALAAVKAAGQSTDIFTLSNATAVSFYIPDQGNGSYPNFTDNTGGVSLDLKAVTPEPSSLVLLGTGAMAMAGAVKRRIMA